MLGGYMPEVFAATIRDVTGFANPSPRSSRLTVTELHATAASERCSAPTVESCVCWKLRPPRRKVAMTAAGTAARAKASDSQPHSRTWTRSTAAASSSAS